MPTPANLDLSVCILFFNRPRMLSRLLGALAAADARPARLYLYQDGPRGEHDLPGIEACREVAEHVGWPCEVHRLYQERNYGCDPSNYMAQRWAFSQTDKCVFLEDDDVPSPSFLPFCKEMLDRYEHDERIGMIAGFNPDEVTTDVDADYFFTTNFSIWGWASWRRVFDRWDAHYGWLDDAHAVGLIERLTDERRLRTDFLPMCRAHRASGKAYYETIFHAALLLHSQLAVVPRVNLIRNLGVTDDSTHFAGSVRQLPHGYRRIFTMGAHTLDFPLRHPRYVADHVAYRRRVYRIMAWRHPWIKAGRALEELWLNLRYGQFRRIFSAIGQRVRKWAGKQSFH